jgi:hypothetical protein
MIKSPHFLAGCVLILFCAQLCHGRGFGGGNSDGSDNLSQTPGQPTYDGGTSPQSGYMYGNIGKMTTYGEGTGAFGAANVLNDYSNLISGYQPPQPSPSTNTVGLPSDEGMHHLSDSVPGPIVGPDGKMATPPQTGSQKSADQSLSGSTPLDRYQGASIVRSNFDRYALFDQGWRTQHPKAWFAPGWNPQAEWMTATWQSLGGFLGYGTTQPIYYNYGANLVVTNNEVFLSGKSLGTLPSYTQKAIQLATDGQSAKTEANDQWLPLGVFALTPKGKYDSFMIVQLAINEDGIVRGNYVDTTHSELKPISGAADKDSQRIVWCFGNSTDKVVETGLYNLTIDSAPALVYVNGQSTQSWILVRLHQLK